MTSRRNHPLRSLVIGYKVLTLKDRVPIVQLLAKSLNQKHISSLLLLGGKPLSNSQPETNAKLRMLEVLVTHLLSDRLLRR